MRAVDFSCAAACQAEPLDHWLGRYSVLSMAHCQYAIHVYQLPRVSPQCMHFHAQRSRASRKTSFSPSPVHPRRKIPATSSTRHTPSSYCWSLVQTTQLRTQTPVPSSPAITTSTLAFTPGSPTCHSSLCVVWCLAIPARLFRIAVATGWSHDLIATLCGLGDLYRPRLSRVWR